MTDFFRRLVKEKKPLSIIAGVVILLLIRAGKTTVTRLVPRFYDPDAGRVLVGGHDVRTLDLAYLRRQVAVVSQEIFLAPDGGYACRMRGMLAPMRLCPARFAWWLPLSDVRG